MSILSDRFKENVKSGYYSDHKKGSELLDMDLQEVIGTCNEEISTARHENEGLIIDNKKLTGELSEAKSELSLYKTDAENSDK